MQDWQKSSISRQLFHLLGPDLIIFRVGKAESAAATYFITYSRSLNRKGQAPQKGESGALGLVGNAIWKLVSFSIKYTHVL